MFVFFKKNRFSFSRINYLLICFFVFNLFSFNCYSIDVDVSIVQQTEDEALFLRRVIEFWEEGQSNIVKKEIENFISVNPSSKFTDYLYALLGDIYISEDSLTLAVGKYAQIKNLEIKENIFVNYLQGLYLLKKYPEICKEFAACPQILEKNDKDTQIRFNYILGDSYYNQALSSTDIAIKRSFANSAKSFFSKLFDTSYENTILEKSASIESMLQNYKIAGDLFLKLAHKNADSREEFLFHAATMQMMYDKVAAEKTFTKICHNGKTRQNEAAFNRFLLLADGEKWAEIISLKKQFHKLLSSSNLSVYNFYLAKSYFMLQKHKEASEATLDYIDKSNKTSTHISYALQMLMSLGEKLGSPILFDRAIAKHEAIFSKEEGPSLSNMYLARAIFYKKNEDYEKAGQDFSFLENNCTKFDSSIYALEAAHFYHKTKDYLRARLYFKSYINKSQNLENRTVAWNYFIDSSSKIVESISSDKKKIASNVLVEDIEYGLRQEGLFSKRETADYKLLLAQTKYDLLDIDGALDILTSLCNDNDLSADPSINLLLAYCYRDKEDNSSYCKYAEKALGAGSALSINQDELRVSLFNTYVKRYATEQNDTYLLRAADHLFLGSSYDLDKLGNKIDIERNNILWLADYYYSKVKDYIGEDWKKSVETNSEINMFASRAILTIEKLVSVVSSDFEIDKTNLYLEEPLFMLSDLYGIVKDKKAEKTLLENLVNSYEKGLESIYKEKAYFQLASVFLELNDKAMAREQFSKVTAMQNRSSYNLSAKLNLARLEIEDVSESHFTLDNPKIISELAILKNIKLQKSLLNEPIHIEAALDYIDVHAKADNSLEKKISMLKKVKEDFISGGDIISDDYQNSKKLYPYKEKIIGAYLKYIDATIYLFTAEKEKNKSKLVNAEGLLKELKDENLNLTLYLDKKMTETLDGINQVKENGFVE